GVFKYMLSKPAENALNAEPASQPGTFGINCAAPTLISVAAITQRKAAGDISANTGTPFAAICCKPSASSSEMLSFPIPELSTQAPVVKRNCNLPKLITHPALRESQSLT